MMIYFFVVIGIITLAACLAFCRQKGMSSLLDNSFALETLLVAERSAPVKVKMTPFLLILLLFGALILLPAMMGALGFYAPCMPPTITMQLKGCRDWGSNPGLSLVVKLLLAGYEILTFWGISGTVAFLFGGLILYPSVVAEMWITELEKRIK